MIRHWCDQNDQLKYEWTYHDGENFANENIQDQNLQLNIQWMKSEQDWTTRIHVTPQVTAHFEHLLPFMSRLFSS
mgnify:CR=1 FL=1